MWLFVYNVVNNIWSCEKIESGLHHGMPWNSTWTQFVIHVRKPHVKIKPHAQWKIKNKLWELTYEIKTCALHVKKILHLKNVWTINTICVSVTWDKCDHSHVKFLGVSITHIHREKKKTASVPSSILTVYVEFLCMFSLCPRGFHPGSPVGFHLTKTHRYVYSLQ